MMKRTSNTLTAFGFFCAQAGVFAQQGGEVLMPLTMRPVPEALEALRKSGGKEYFIYQNLPQTLPIVDDFSVDRTRKRWAKPDDPGVTLQETIYRLAVDGVSTPDMAFANDTTFRFIVDQSDPDTIIFSSEALPSVQLTVRNLSVYPPTENIVTAWPPYNIIDSLQVPPADTLWIISPPWTQDSLLVYLVPPVPDTYNTGGNIGPLILWEDDDVFVNGNYPVNPPTVGVATFDGLARNGLPYEAGNYLAYGVADKLTSVPIDMFHPASDSIYLSFFVQPQGLSGDNQSQPQDSLVLEFFAPQENLWYKVWSRPHSILIPFQQVMIPIKEFRYLQNGFRMRFKNYATLSGAFDHWHLDYVRLAANRTQSDTTLTDVAWMVPASTLLETYTSVPFNKFSQSPGSYMAQSVTTLQRNLDDDDRFVTWRMQAGLDEGPVLFDPPSYGNNTSNNAYTIFPSVHPINSAPNNFTYDTSLSEDAAFWRVRFITNTTPDVNRYNDTITFVQELSNYYSYDDGSAEAGYSLNIAGAQLAHRFDIVGGDSLRAIRMYFLPMANPPPDQQPTQGSFLITVWKQLTPEPVIIHQNFSFSSPEYRDHGHDKFVEYPLDSTIWVDGTFYIGWTQTNNVKMNLGFDKNRNNNNKIFFRTGLNWQITVHEGSLMMRPVFVSAVDPFLGVEEPVVMGDELLVYPNPATESFQLSLPETHGGERVQCLDATGRLVLEQAWSPGQPVSTDAMANGLHLVRVLDHAGLPLGQARLLILR